MENPILSSPVNDFFFHRLCVNFFTFPQPQFFSLWTSGFPQVVFPHFTGLVEFFWGGKGPGCSRGNFSAGCRIDFICRGGGMPRCAQIPYTETVRRCLPACRGSLFSVPSVPASIFVARSIQVGGRGVPRPYTSETILPAIPYKLELIFAVISRRLFWILLSPFFRAISTFRMAYRMVVWSRLNSLPMSGRLRFVIFRMR